MSEQQIYEFQKTLEEIKSGQEKLFRKNGDLFKKLSSLEDRVYRDHHDKLKELEELTPTEKDIERFQAVADALGNWRFLFKFFGVIGTIFTLSVTILYYIVELVKAIR